MQDTPDFPPPELDRNQFLNLAALVEGGTAALAFGLGWLAGISPTSELHVSPRALLVGVIAAMPLVAGYLLLRRSTWQPLARIHRLLLETLAPLLDRCRWYDLFLLAVLAGVCEELLFRGVLQPWMSRQGLLFGLLGSNLLFALAHLITPAYAVLAGVAGLYFGLLMLYADSSGLLAAIVAHALYDWLAFVLLVREYRWRQRTGQAEAGADDTSGSVPPED